MVDFALEVVRVLIFIYGRYQGKRGTWWKEYSRHRTVPAVRSSGCELPSLVVASQNKGQVKNISLRLYEFSGESFIYTIVLLESWYKRFKL